MQLYGVRGYGSAITEAMLALTGQSYEFVDVDGFEQPGLARDRLAAVNPLVQVPALRLDDGSVLTETAACGTRVFSDQSETLQLYFYEQFHPISLVLANQADRILL